MAETTQGFITFMDALKLKLRAKDQLHPLLSDLMSSYSRFSTASNGNDQDASSQGRAKVLHWSVDCLHSFLLCQREALSDDGYLLPLCSQAHHAEPDESERRNRRGPGQTGE